MKFVFLRGYQIILLSLFLNIFSQKAIAVSFSHLDLKGAEYQNQNIIHSQKLKTLFVQFQAQYLNFEFKKAKVSLKDIVAMRFLNDWNEMERKIISTSYLRLAQMDGLYRYQWIEEFLAFAKDPFIDTELFPPSFVAWVNEQHQEFQTKTDIWYGQNLPEKITTLVINGEAFDRLGFSRRIHPKFKYRITLLEHNQSDQKSQLVEIHSSLDFSMILNGKDLMAYPFEPSQLTTQLERESKASFQDILQSDMSDKIELQKQNMASQDLKEQKDIEFTKSTDSEVNLQTVDMSRDQPLNLNGGHAPDDLTKTSLSSKSFLKRHPWVWIVLGGVTLSAVISMTRSKSKKKANVIHQNIIFH